MSTPAPRISVMMPVYNTASYIAQAVKSVLDQSMRDFELVIIDDGSTDGSDAIVRSLAASDSRMRFTARGNVGAVQTRNEILAQCRGQYLAVLDSDDIALPDRLAQQTKFLDQNPDVVAVGGSFDLIDGKGRKLTTLNPPTEDAEIQQRLLAGHCSLCHSCGMIRREAMQAVGGYDTHFMFAQDLDLWLRLGEHGKLANLKETVVSFRLHDKSISETKRHEQRALAREACERAWKRRSIQGNFEASQPWRPGRDSESRHKYAMMYGWWAFQAGERRTAALYACKAIAACPSKLDSYKLLVSSAIKPTPRPAATA